MGRRVEVELEYQQLIAEPPVTPQAMYQQACANDTATVAHWRDIWLGNITANKQKYGAFKDHSIGQLFQKHRYSPIIIAGSGPSLKVNAHELKNRGPIPLVSCLHNFHLFEDLGLETDYYVSLDAGEVTIEEVYEGGSKSPEEYWALTKNRTLLAFCGSHPGLLEKWQGKILFFNAPFPDVALAEAADKIEKFNVLVSSGGNVLGACLYIAKTILGAGSIIFVGADFSFGYEKKFHAWDSKYDKTMGETVPIKDIYGIWQKTWPSYLGFKNYFDSVSLRLPGVYYNCTEGGCLGAYPNGNLHSFKYMNLRDCLDLLNWNDKMRDSMENPELEPKKLFYS